MEYESLFATITLPEPEGREWISDFDIFITLLRNADLRYQVLEMVQAICRDPVKCIWIDHPLISHPILLHPTTNDDDFAHTLQWRRALTIERMIRED